MKQTEVKICGITTLEDINLINQYRPEYAGFVFFEKSKRNLSEEKAKELLSCLDSAIMPVAVCVSPTLSLLERLKGLGFFVIQVHGTLSSEVLQAWNGDIWQAVNLGADDASMQLCEDKKIKAYVVDAAKYGSGRTSGWDEEIAKRDAIQQYLNTLKKTQKLLVFAGGLNPENVGQAISLFAPDVVDVSSGVEGDCGKSAVKVQRFIENSKAENLK